MDDLAMVNLSISDAEKLLYGIQRTAEALGYDVFSHTAEGVLHEDENISTGKNAENWIRLYYDLIGGVMQMIGGATGIITAALTNGELHIVGEGATK